MTSETSGALSMMPLKEPIPMHSPMTHKVMSDKNKIRIKDTLARVPTIEEREVRALRFLSVDCLP